MRAWQGFCVLIAKEWLSYGHRFRERLGHTVPAGTGKRADHVSPIFLQVRSRARRCRYLDTTTATLTPPHTPSAASSSWTVCGSS